MVGEVCSGGLWIWVVEGFAVDDRHWRWRSERDHAKEISSPGGGRTPKFQTTGGRRGGSGSLVEFL